MPCIAAIFRASGHGRLRLVQGASGMARGHRRAGCRGALEVTAIPDAIERLALPGRAAFPPRGIPAHPATAAHDAAGLLRIAG
jgi:hypothetical protein